jgi:hypothetical protein
MVAFEGVKNMKKLMLMIGVLAFSTASFAAPTKKASADALAKETLVKLVKDGTDKDVAAAVKELEDDGLKQTGEASSALLHAQGGIAGTSSVFLVTVPFQRSGVNPTTLVVAAIVSANGQLGTSRVAKVLSSKDLEKLAE